MPNAALHTHMYAVFFSFLSSSAFLIVEKLNIKKRNIKFWNIVSISPCSQSPEKKWMRNQNVYMYVFQSDKVKYYTVLQTKYGPFVVFFSSDKQQYPKKTDSQRTFALCKCLRAYTRKMMMMSFKETLKQY